MGPPLNSSTATISLRRRPDSFRAAASGAAVESWLILLSPSVVAAPRLCRSCTFPLGPARVPRRKTVMIESTVSHGAGVTSSPPGALSTWQLGVKHSITKRCTRGPCREVRLVPVAGPRRVRAAPWPLSVQVERGVEGCSTKGCAGNRSWLKRYGGVRGNRSVDRRTRTGVPSAPVRPGRGASPSAALGVRSSAIERAGALGVAVARLVLARGAVARVAVVRAARAAPRSDWRRRTRQAPVTAARPRAVPVAPAREVPYQTRTTGTRTQLKAAQRTTSVAVSIGWAEDWRALSGVLGGAGGVRPLRGRTGARCGARTLRAPSWLPRVRLTGVQRVFDLSVTGAVGSGCHRVVIGVFSLARASAASVFLCKPAVRGSNHCVTGRCSCMLPGTPRSRCGNWAEEACGRTLGGMGWGR